MTKERFDKAKKLKLIITAGIGSDHTDLQAAMDKGVTVAEVTYSNSISVSEHIVMMILALVRNYIPSYGWVVSGGWNIADSVERSYDLEGMNVGTVAAGRIGLAALRRLKPFDVKLHYYDKHRLPKAVEEELGLTFHPTVESLVKVCDVVTINAPLHPETENLFNDKLIGMMKRGSYIVNTARGKIVDRDAVVRALESGQLAGYAGDVWFPQPAPKDHPWRTMPHHGMTPHVSGTSLSAQTRYAAGTREISKLFRRQADPHRVSDRRQGQARRHRRQVLHRGRRHQGRRGGLDTDLEGPHRFVPLARCGEPQAARGSTVNRGQASGNNSAEMLRAMKPRVDLALADESASRPDRRRHARADGVAEAAGQGRRASIARRRRMHGEFRCAERRQAADRPADLPLLRAREGQWTAEGAHRGGVRRRHHERDRFRSRPERQPDPRATACGSS